MIDAILELPNTIGCIRCGVYRFQMAPSVYTDVTLCQYTDAKLSSRIVYLRYTCRYYCLFYHIRMPVCM